ncbi:MAG TPA: hypothetical protein VK625_06000, partial [Flavitalea sp.]|nr:hypothetical protein [Flavitalea sp.]
MNRQARNKEQIAGHEDDNQNHPHDSHANIGQSQQVNDHSNTGNNHSHNRHDHSNTHHDHMYNEHDHTREGHDHSHDGHDHGGNQKTGWKQHWELLVAATILVILLTLEYAFSIRLPQVPSLFINVLAYILAGREVFILALRKVSRGDIFNEFVLMTVATIGAFIIGEYEEGVAVMVF